MSDKFPVVALTAEQIALAATPMDANQPEAISAVLFDTLTVTAAASGSRLLFFQANSITDPTVTNILGGRLPQGYSFQAFAMGFDILRVPTINAAAPSVVALLDIATILKTNRGIAQLTKSQKGYGWLPLTFLHASGGEVGNLSESAGGIATGAGGSYGNNGIFSGGYYLDGSVIIRENENFSVEVLFANSTTAVSADVPVRMWMRGTLFRPVR